MKLWVSRWNHPCMGLKVKSSLIILFVPKSSDKCSWDRSGKTQTLRRKPCEDEGRDWSDVKEQPGEAGRERNGSPLVLPEGCGTVDTLMSDFWPPDSKRMNFCCFNYLVFGHLLWKLQEVNTGHPGINSIFETCLLCIHSWFIVWLEMESTCKVMIIFSDTGKW